MTVKMKLGEILLRVEEIEGLYPPALARSYLQGEPGVIRLFQYDPRRQEAFRDHLEYLLTQRQEPLDLPAECLKEYNLSLGCGSQTTANIELIEKNRAVAVVTGQQPGFLTGPLYTIYKAMGTIVLARKLTRELGHPVVPVFWIGADDHDFAEVNHIYLPTSQGPQRVGLEEKPGVRFSLGHLPVPEEAGRLLDQIKELTPPMGWQQEGIELLRKTARNSLNVADWFGRLMTFLFKDYGLVMVNPLLKPLRQRSAGLFYQAVMSAPRADQLLDSACREIRSLGFSPQVQSEGNKAHLFLYIQGQRQTLFADKQTFYNREKRTTWEREQLAEQALTQPDSFSPDVVLRPVLQNKLFPVLAYVAGPGEMGYFAQFKRIFELFNERMPVIYPRPNVTLVEPLIHKLMQKYHVPLEQIPRGLEDFIAVYLEQSDEVGIAALFNEFNEMLKKHHKGLVKKVAIINPVIQGLGQDCLRRMTGNLRAFEAKVNQHHRRNHEAALRQLAKINHMLHPLGQWQERVYNVFPYLMKYGPDCIGEMISLMDVENWQQKILFFD